MFKTETFLIKGTEVITSHLKFLSVNAVYYKRYRQIAKEKAFVLLSLENFGHKYGPTPQPIMPIKNINSAAHEVSGHANI